MHTTVVASTTRIIYEASQFRHSIASSRSMLPASLRIGLSPHLSAPPMVSPAAGAGR